MKSRLIKLGLGLLFVTVPILTNGQSTKEIIEDSWIYLDTFENFKRNENIELVKSWNVPQICVVSFEKGLFTLSGESSEDQEEKGSWRIEETEGRMLLVISNDSGPIYKFEVVSVDKNKLKLKRLT